MRLVLVHGINNENTTPGEVESIWMTALEGAWRRNGLRSPTRLSVVVPYYAAELARLSMIPRGAATAGSSPRLSQTEFDLLQAYANAMGVTVSDIENAAEQEGIDLERVEAGVPHEKWIILLSRVLENILPTRGKYIARVFLPQAAVYLERQGVQRRIKEIVRSKMFSDENPTVVVGHSLGTVISYELLTESIGTDRSTPLFCTLGSPLAVAIVSNYVGVRKAFPRPPVGRWINALHTEDFVTLGRELDRSSMGFDGIENDTTIVNPGEDKHDIRAYLSTPSIAKAIHVALTQG